MDVYGYFGMVSTKNLYVIRKTIAAFSRGIISKKTCALTSYDCSTSEQWTAYSKRTVMNKETASYIITYFSHLLTLKEKAVIKHQHSLIKLDNSDSSEASEQNQRRRAMYLKQGWLSTDTETLNLLKDGYEQFEIDTATRLISERSEEIVLNKCPKCGRLARTPYAKQCRFCGHDWHNLVE